MSACPWVVVDAKRGGAFVCTACNGEYMPGLPAPVSVLTAMMDAFQRDHFRCGAKKGQKAPPKHKQQPDPDSIEVSVGVREGQVEVRGSVRPDGEKHVAVRRLAEEFVRSFQETGAANFLSFDFPETPIGPLSVVLQRVEGKTPAAVQCELQDLLRRTLPVFVWLSHQTDHPQHAEWEALGYEILRTPGVAR